jgi:hypothetical protein
MCYVFKEDEVRWYPWCLRSEHVSCESHAEAHIGYDDNDAAHKQARKGLVAWYRFEHNDTAMLWDHSGNAHHLENQGASFDTQDFREGRGSIRFGGMGAYSQFPQSLNLTEIFWDSGLHGITFSLWAKISPSTS